MRKGKQQQAELGASPDMWGSKRVETLGGSGTRGAWFAESRFAMFIHWGLYSEAAGCWNGRAYYCIAEWLMHSARIPVREYEQLCKRFNPLKFDARTWVRLVKDAGMKYIVITAKHHDGFAMFKSKASLFNIVDATPFRRDPIAELAEECRRGGLKLGLYYSQFQDWHEPDAAGNTWDFPAPGNFNRYLHEKAMPQIKELLTNYGPVALIWFDTPGTISKNASKELLDTVRRLQPDCLVNSRIGNGLGDYVTLGDQEIPLTAPDGLWETIDTHNDTWAFAKNDHDWKGAGELIGRLARTASLGGNYMLNVGPTGEGVIPEASASILREVGAWLRRNGESIYGTCRSPLGLQAWGCSTMRDGKLFLHVIDWPRNGELWIPGAGSAVEKAQFLATQKPLKLFKEGAHLMIELPPRPPDSPVSVVELAMKKPFPKIPSSIFLHEGLTNELSAPGAILKGCRLGKRSWMEKFGDWHHCDIIEGWTKGAEAAWNFTAFEPGRFHIYADYECWPEADYSEFEIEVAGLRFSFPAIYTGGGKGFRYRNRRNRLALVDIPSGPGRLTVRALDVKNTEGFTLKSITMEVPA